MKKIIVTLFAFAIGMMIFASNGPAEDLFDTAAASRLLEKGFDHLAKKNYDAAINVFEDSASIEPSAEAFYYLGYSYYMKGKVRNDPRSRKKAINSFDKAYELDPNFTPTRIEPEDEVTVSSRPLSLKEMRSEVEALEDQEETLTDEELTKEVEEDVPADNDEEKEYTAEDEQEPDS